MPYKFYSNTNVKRKKDGTIESFPFTNATSYKLFVATWKEEYKEITVLSRRWKQARATLGGKGFPTGDYQSRVMNIRADARQMIEIRLAAKVEAQRLWLAEQAEKAAAPAVAGIGHNVTA